MFRQFFALSLFTTASLVILPIARAEHEHAQHMLACAKACDDCARTCEACAAHCGKMLEAGKHEHATTHRLCSDCSTVCRAAGLIAARQGPMNAVMCAACADACKQCGDACEKLKADTMMKDCAEECRKCEKACRDMIAMSRPGTTK